MYGLPFLMSQTPCCLLSTVRLMSESLLGDVGGRSPMHGGPTCEAVEAGVVFTRTYSSLSGSFGKGGSLG